MGIRKKKYCELSTWTIMKSVEIFMKIKLPCQITYNRRPDITLNTLERGSGAEYPLCIFCLGTFCVFCSPQLGMNVLNVIGPNIRDFLPQAQWREHFGLGGGWMLGDFLDGRWAKRKSFNLKPYGILPIYNNSPASWIKSQGSWVRETRNSQCQSFEKLQANGSWVLNGNNYLIKI